MSIVAESFVIFVFNPIAQGVIWVPFYILYLFKPCVPAQGHAIVAQWQRMTFPRSRLGVRVPSIALLMVVVVIVIMIYCFPLSSVTAWRGCRESQGVVQRAWVRLPLPAQAKKMA